jgi:hypothetical protein
VNDEEQREKREERENLLNEVDVKIHVLVHLWYSLLEESPSTDEISV